MAWMRWLLYAASALVITLVHFDRFHFSSPVPSAQGAAWFWLAIYAGVPVAMLLVGWRQLRVPGGDPPPGPAPPVWMRVVVLAQGGAMLAFGVGLLAAPTVVGSVWPWPLTALTGRAVGAWFVGIGFAAFHGVRENDFLRIRPLGGGYTVFAILELAVLGRYSGSIDWSGASAWVYLAFLRASSRSASTGGSATVGSRSGYGENELRAAPTRPDRRAVLGLDRARHQEILMH